MEREKKGTYAHESINKESCARVCMYVHACVQVTSFWRPDVSGLVLRVLCPSCNDAMASHILLIVATFLLCEVTNGGG
jgi:hypothetical protein